MFIEDGHIISLPMKPGWNQPHAFRRGTERIMWCDVCGRDGGNSIHNTPRTPLDVSIGVNEVVEQAA